MQPVLPQSPKGWKLRKPVVEMERKEGELLTIRWGRGLQWLLLQEEGGQRVVLKTHLFHSN
jgi:hypothetical protein